MSDTDQVFAGSIPENYDRYLVPLIFAPYAEDLACRAASLAPGCILETAAGSGALTRALAPKLGARTCYTASDLNAPMLAFAKSRQEGDRRIVWQTLDAQTLPFDDAAFDIVCCQFGVMFLPAKARAYREAKRVLKPGGRFLFNVWDRIEENVFADDVTEALSRYCANDPPRFLARTPHGYHDVDQIRGDLVEAGFANVEIETKPEQARAANAMHPAFGYCQGTPLSAEISARAPGKLDAATAFCAAAIAERHGSGPMATKIQAHIVTAFA